MKLTRFIDFLTESRSLTKEDIENLLIGISDKGMEFEVGMPIQIPTGEHKGKMATKISIYYKNVKKDQWLAVTEFDDDMLEALVEIATAAARLRSEAGWVGLNFANSTRFDSSTSTLKDSLNISITYVHEGDAK